ncbi:transporter family-2 protein [Paenibacillus taihuensis]|uniref:Transporter family-2 protein n=1 Tax=Paenibacillus taihuensis TaxID=1156355 RepID=A0A3D9S710_9BACL|nr:DMT family transporter [Paenibacillus taihuensis]REE88947.1 transporter family-2 protein [Paenibacillus taihuensis]
MMVGVVLALMAGMLVSVQTLFNNKVNTAVHSHTTTALVLGMGFIASLGVGVIMEGADFFNWPAMPLWFWFSGLLGIGVVTCVVKGVRLLGPSTSTTMVMASQLVCALWWDSTGWFGLEQVPFSWQKAIGVTALIAGLLLFKFQTQAKTSKADLSKPLTNSAGDSKRRSEYVS